MKNLNNVLIEVVSNRFIVTEDYPMYDSIRNIASVKINKVSNTQKQLNKYLKENLIPSES